MKSHPHILDDKNPQAGGIATPLKYESQLGLYTTVRGEKHVPDHQPVIADMEIVPDHQPVIVDMEIPSGNLT